MRRAKPAVLLPPGFEPEGYHTEEGGQLLVWEVNSTEAAEQGERRHSYHPNPRQTRLARTTRFGNVCDSPRSQSQRDHFETAADTRSACR